MFDPFRVAILLLSCRYIGVMPSASFLISKPQTRLTMLKASHLCGESDNSQRRISPLPGKRYTHVVGVVVEPEVLNSAQHRKNHSETESNPRISIRGWYAVMCIRGSHVGSAGMDIPAVDVSSGCRGTATLKASHLRCIVFNKSTLTGHMVWKIYKNHALHVLSMFLYALYVLHGENHQGTESRVLATRRKDDRNALAHYPPSLAFHSFTWAWISRRLFS